MESSLSLVRLIEKREQASPAQLEVFDHIAASRGGVMIRPYAAMVHRPEIARAAADLGAIIRFESTLPDPVRELVIVTTAIERDCEFEWESHRELAAEAGVAEATLEAVQVRSPVDDPDDSDIAELVRALCRSERPSDQVQDRLFGRFGEEGFVELAAIIGYYSMLGVFMNACEAC